MAKYHNQGSQRGSVLVEGSLALPFLALILLLLFDSLSISRNYISLTLIAREVVRSASTLTGLNGQLTVSATAPTEAQLKQCYDSTMSTYQPPANLTQECARRVIAQRVSSLIQAYNLPLSANSTVVELNTNTTNRLVGARVKTKIEGLSFLLKGTSVKTTATGSYDA